MVKLGALIHRNSCSRIYTAPQERTVATLCVSWWKHCISNAPLPHPGEQAVLASSSCAMNRPLPRWNWHLCCSHFVISSKGEWQGRVLLFSQDYEVQIRAHSILCRQSLLPENCCSRVSLKTPSKKIPSKPKQNQVTGDRDANSIRPKN